MTLWAKRADWSRGWMLAGTAAVALTLAACGKEATGQVAAVVNGEEISLQELNMEIGGMPLPEGANKDKVRQQILQRIVDRRLLAGAAREEGIDRDPEFLMRKRQLEEALLIQLYGKKTGNSLRLPDDAAVTKYIAENPQAFANRTIYTLDQVQFNVPPKADTLKALESLHSLGAVIAFLEQNKIPFSRQTNKIDSAQVPPEMLKQILALPPGEPFFVPAAGAVAVSVVVGSQPVTVPSENTRPMATQALRNQELGKILDARLKEAKKKADIKYQTGFAPDSKDAQKPNLNPADPLSTPGVAPAATPAATPATAPAN